MKRFGWMLVPCVALLGCGGGAGNFVGTWSVVSGSETITCGTQTETGTPIGNNTIVEGTDSDIVLTDANGCNQKFNVNGSTATLVPGQTCALGTTGIAASLTTGTIALGSDNKSFTLTETMTASDSSESCTINITSASNKVGG
jgi:hypothetical protein